MALNRRTLAFQLSGLLCAVAVAVGLQARESLVAPQDVYPYQVSDSTHGGCGFAYIELDGRSEPLPLAPAASGADPDDAAAVLQLQRPFEFYQSPGNAFVVSGNGYLAAADSLTGDDGSDFSNDCPLPAAPDNPRHSGNRIYVYHDDLRARPGAVGVRQAYFAHCPRPSAAGVDEPCTVVEWNGFERVGPLPSSAPLQAQAVLYHGSHEVALQYASVDDSRGATATIGLQGMDGGAGRKSSCNVAIDSLPRSAVCFVDPRGRRGPALAASR